MSTWTNNYLKENFGEEQVKVSVSSNGEFEYVESITNWTGAADFWRGWLKLAKGQPIPPEVLSKAPQPGKPLTYQPCPAQNEKCLRFTLDRVLVRPATKKSSLKQFLNNDAQDKTNSYYIQYENVPKSLQANLTPPKWANFLKHDMTGLWLGLGRTKANLHYDANENLMFMVAGSKKWTLFEPALSNSLYEGFCKESKLEIAKSKWNYDIVQRSEAKNEDISFFNSPVQLSNVDFDRFPLLRAALPPKVCHLNQGEILYLPSFWWHEVESTPDGEGRTIGINYWYSPYKTKPIPCPTCIPKVNEEEYPMPPFSQY